MTALLLQLQGWNSPLEVGMANCSAIDITLPIRTGIKHWAFPCILGVGLEVNFPWLQYYLIQQNCLNADCLHEDFSLYHIQIIRPTCWKAIQLIRIFIVLCKEVHKKWSQASTIFSVLGAKKHAYTKLISVNNKHHKKLVFAVQLHKVYDFQPATVLRQFRSCAPQSEHTGNMVQLHIIATEVSCQERIMRKTVLRG